MPFLLNLWIIILLIIHFINSYNFFNILLIISKDLFILLFTNYNLIKLKILFLASILIRIFFHLKFYSLNFLLIVLIKNIQFI